jgi:hypothetical protein
VRPIKRYGLLAHLYGILAGFVSQVGRFSRIILLSILLFFYLVSKYICDVSNRWVHSIQKHGISGDLCRILAIFLFQVRIFSWIISISISVSSVLAINYRRYVLNM